jgi:very-short-patch-repair endonuclease
MSRIATRELSRRFRDQHGVVSRSQLQALGVGSRAVQRRLATGEWEAPSSKTVRLAGAARTPEQDLFALCLTAGPSATASHQSASWLWQFSPSPARHAVTIPRTSSGRAVIGDVHRPRDFPGHVGVVRNIPCTDPLRTIVDVAAVTSPEDLEDIVDRALASKMVSLEAIDAEAARLARQGRRGVQALRSTLRWRRTAGVAHPSVLESRVLRLLKRARVTPTAIEVKAGSDLSYRVDIMLRPGLALEVDGYAFHHSPEQMAEDARRRNRLYLSGTQVLVYTWRDVVFDGHRVIAEVRQALAQSPTLQNPSTALVG